MSRRTQIVALLVLVCLCLGLGSPHPASAVDQPVKVYLFWTIGCPHCLHEKAFLAALEGRDQAVKVIALEVSARRENRELFQQVGKLLQADISGVPFTVIGDQYVIGWQDEATTGRAVEAAIREARAAGGPRRGGRAPGRTGPHSASARR